MSDFSSILHNEPYQFLQPTDEHQRAAIAAAKCILDPLAKEVAETQLRRRNENRRKRKRGSDDVEDPVLQLRQIYTNGLAVKQVWEQARRILDAAYDEVERGIEEFQDKFSPQSALNGIVPEYADDDELELDASDDEQGASVDDLDESDLGSDIEMDEDVLDDEDIEDIEEGSDIDVEEGEDEFDAESQVTYKADPNKLNDGFFSIDDFNKQSQFLEQMDARGDDDNPSDEDEVDWDADPLAQPLPTKKPVGNQKNAKQAEEDSEEDQDGPVFGNADLNAPDSDDDVSQDDVEEGDLDGMMDVFANTNEIRYTDFFEPPPKKPSKSKRMRALPKTQPPKQNGATNEDEDEDNAELERAMADVKRDLLDSEDELDEDEEAASDDSDALPGLSAKLKDKNLSTHEKQKLQIAEEIRRLEAINVSKKPWTLSGEASAGARPLNSLIEEDLDFERTGKPVPVITAETTTDIEALIKRRILNRDFDELNRRRPTSLDSAADARRGRADVVVDDNKATTGLGEIYESEYQRNADPTSYVDKRSAATKKQHDEISKVWKEVREQLDILANLNIKPRRAEVEIRTVEDKPRIAMEDAQPAVSGGIDEIGGMLAPQEIYKPGTDSRAESGEILNAKSGASRNKEEMTREEKLRRRRREKERQKKAGGNQKAATASDTKKSGKRAEKERIVKDLQKAGAKVIGKGGELQDIDPKKKKGDGTAAVSGGALKL